MGSLFLQLARYLNRTYWEKKQEEARKSPTPSAPAPVPLAEPVPAINQPVESHVPVQPVNIVEVWSNVQKADGWVCDVDVFRPRISLCSCFALSAAVSEWRIGGEPRAVSQSSAECRHHFSQPHEEQPYARAQHHQWQCCALTLSVHQQHAPSVVGYSQPARWEAMWVFVLQVSACAFIWDRVSSL